MEADRETAIPPVLGVKRKEAAPTLYAIVGLKLFTGLVLLFCAFLVYSVRNTNLADLERVLQDANLAAPSSVLASSGVQISEITPGMLRMISLGSLLYGALSLAEGAGLWARAAWAGWLVIGETAIFIPLEIWDLARQLSVIGVLLLALNSAILWYLYANRQRLFRLK